MDKQLAIIEKDRFVAVNPIKSEDIVAQIENAFLDESLDSSDTLKLVVRLKRMQDGIDKVLKKDKIRDILKAAGEKQLALHKKTSLEVEEATIQVTATYTAYDYSDCSHPITNFFGTSDKTGFQKKIKETIEPLLKEFQLINEGKPTTVVTEDGEEVVKIVGGSKTYIIDDNMIGQIAELYENLQLFYSELIQKKGEVFEVVRPYKTQTIGLKISGK